MLAEWIDKGHAPRDLWDVDIRRNMPFRGLRSICRNVPLKHWVCCMKLTIRLSSSKLPVAYVVQYCMIS
ncbi:hypothetical protein [Aliamphritea spongicola]|nr:hypothetical protein [Aliamphritea spongicola]